MSAPFDPLGLFAAERATAAPPQPSGDPVIQQMLAERQGVAPEKPPPFLGNMDVSDPPYVRNTDGSRRPLVFNKDGTVSSVHTISIATDEGEVLIPTVVGNKIVSNEEAIAHYRKTGENLGVFANAEEADAYSMRLHLWQERALDAGQANGSIRAPDPVIVQMQEERRKATELQANLVRWRAANETAPAQQRADVLRYSAASGLAPDFVEKNLPDVKRQVDAAQVNWTEVARRQPVLLKFLLDDPAVQAVANDDTANLGGIEWALTSPFHAFADAVREQGTVARQFVEAEGLGSEENRQAIRESEAQFAGKTYGAETWLEKAWIGLPRMLPYVAGDIAARAVGGLAGGAVAGSAAAETGPGAVVAGGGGALVGQYVASGLFNYAESVGPLYWRLRSVPGVDEATARALAQGGGFVQGVLGSALLGKLGGSLPGVKGVLEKIGGQTVEKALAEETKTGAFGAFAKRYGETVATGAVLMAAQSAVNQVAEESAKGLTGGETRWANVADAGGRGFVTGLQDMALFAAIGPGKELLSDLGRARRGAESAARLDALSKGTLDSKLAERLPEKFQAFVARLKQEGKVASDVLVPVDAWKEYWAGQKLDPAEVAAAVVGDGGKSYAEALQTGGDVRIPVEQYLAKIVRTKHGEKLGQDARLYADAPTPRQYTEEQKALAERMKAEAARREPELKDGREKVEEAYRDKAITAGRSKAEAVANAKIVGEAAGTLAVRTGLSVEEAARYMGLHDLQIEAPGGPKVTERGEVEVTPPEGGKPFAFKINLFNADRSTLAHETGHVLSFALHDLASKDEGVRADYEGLLKFMGYGSAEERAKAQDPAKEEKLAHAWEQYLAEGKAPSKALASPFRRFKTWMLRIYKSLPGISRQYEEKYGQPLNLNDDVRAVFDRMLSVDEAVAEHAPRSDSTAAEAMTPAQRTEYEAAITKAGEHVDASTNAAAAEIARQRVGESRIRIVAEETAAVDQDPAQNAIRALRGAEIDGRKLNRKAFVKQFGADVAREMPPGIFTDKDGMLPGTAAVNLGFEDSRHLVDSLRKAPDRDETIRRRVEDRLDREYGPALKLIQEAAMHAAGTNDAARATLMELRALAKQVDPGAARRVASIDLGILRDTAQAIVGDTKLVDLDPAESRRKERALALKAAELWGKGEKEAALDAKEQRLLNQVLFTEARDRKAELDAARERIRGVSAEKRAQLGKAAPELRDLHDALLGAVGLGPKTAANLDKGLELARSMGEEIDFDAEQLRGVLAKPRAWDLLTVAEAENLHDAVLNLRQIASHQAEVTLAGRAESRDALLADMTRHLAKRKSLPPGAYETTQKTLTEKLRATGRGLDASLADMETIAELMDGGDRDGPWHRLLIDGRIEARTTEVRLAKDVLEKVEKLWHAVPKEIRDLRDQTMDVADLLPSPNPARVRAPVTRATAWSLFLNWGNEGNRQRVIDGNGWSEANVEKVLAMLTHEELTFLQGVLDVTNSLYPELARVHEKRTGLPLPKVSATPITINGKTYRGGYFPLRYDPRFSTAGEKQAGESVEALFGPNYVKPVVSASSRKSRQEKVSRPVSMEWGIVPAHFAQVIRDIAYGDYVREAGSVLTDRRVKDLVAQYAGEERGDKLIPWLRDVANNRADSAAGEVDKMQRTWGNWTRRVMANAALAYNVPNQLQGTLDAFRAPMEGVAFHRVAAAYAKTMNPATWRDFEPFADSREIDLRSARILENMRKQFAEIAPGKHHPTLEAIEETGFRLYAMTDAFGSRVAFRAAYEQATADGKGHEEAVRFGDDVVRKLFPTGDVAEKPPILRSRRGLAAMLMFHTWANRNYNILRRAYEGENRGAAVSALAAKALYYGLLGAGSAYLIGRGPAQGEDKAEWLFTRIALEPLNTLPLVGGAVESLVKGQQVNVRAAPEVAVAVDTLGKIGGLIHKWQKGDASAGEKALAAVELLGIGGAFAGAPVPLGQIHRTGAYLQQLADREQKPRGAFDVARGLAYGPVRKERPADPLTNIQDLLAGR